MKILLCILLILSLGGCKKEDETYTLLNKTNLDCGFDTLCRLDAYVKDEAEFDTYYEKMVALFSYYNDLFDIYNDYEGLNNLKTINDNAGIAPVSVDPLIIEMIDLAKELNDLSEGAFDITDGAILKVWHEYRDRGKIENNNGNYGAIPSQDELDAKEDLHGFEYIEIDRENNTVFISDPDVSLDVGGIAKGFAAEKVAQELEAIGLKYGSVNAGGNQRLIGTKPDGTGFNVGIQDPRGNGLIAVVNDQSAVSVVTSGDYQNYYIGQGDIRYAHIIDPKTNWPATYYYSVSVVCKDSGLADCLSTAFFVLDYEDGLELIEKVNTRYDQDIIVVWVSENPLDETSILSPISEQKEYVTCSANFQDKLITE